MQSNKPQMKKEVALDQALEHSRAIYFYATPDAAGEIGEFGQVIAREGIPNAYRLLVDARFDFGEVVNYIVNYDKLDKKG